MKVCSRVLPGPSSVDIVLFAPAEHHAFVAPLTFDDEIIDSVPANTQYRHKREAYDPYEAYYFYPKSLNQRPAYSYDRQDADDAYINRREADESNRVEAQRGQKYKYTPLFQYKSTQSRRRKLFVPNLFG